MWSKDQVALDVKLPVVGMGEYHLTPFDPEETNTEFREPVSFDRS